MAPLLPSGLCSKSASLNGSTSLLSVYPAFFRFVHSLLLLFCTCLESSLDEVILELGIEGIESAGKKGGEENPWSKDQHVFSHHEAECHLGEMQVVLLWG